jgi:hypothetical protein
LAARTRRSLTVIRMIGRLRDSNGAARAGNERKQKRRGLACRSSTLRPPPRPGAGLAGGTMIHDTPSIFGRSPQGCGDRTPTVRRRIESVKLNPKTEQSARCTCSSYDDQASTRPQSSPAVQPIQGRHARDAMKPAPAERRVVLRRDGGHLRWRLERKSRWDVSHYLQLSYFLRHSEG